MLVCAGTLAAQDAEDSAQAFDSTLAPVAGLDAGDLLYVFPDEAAATALVGWRIYEGDSVEWARPGYDDSHWKEASGLGLWAGSGRPGTGIRWYRKRIFLPEPLEPLRFLSVYQPAVVAASELYWDGELVARNGVVADDAALEEAGRSAQLYVIPSALTRPGMHVIAQRVSNHSTFSGVVEQPLLVGIFSRVRRMLVRNGALPLVLAGVFLFTALFNSAVSFGYRDRRPYALFSAFCTACAAHILIQALWQYFQMDLRWYYVYAALNDIPWLAMMTLLPVFFMYEFSFPRRTRLSLLIGGVALLVVGMPRLVMIGWLPVAWLEPFVFANEVHSYLTILLSAVVSVWAIVRREHGATSSTIGLAAFLFGVWITYQLELTYGWAVGFAILIVFMTVSLSKQMARRHRAYQEAQLRAARLELDLLKKHIQPHFLLNSLNSIIAWLEEDPATAASLVQALADELRLLLRFSAESEVDLADELVLCRAHLKVMGLRYERQYDLVVDGDVEGVSIPPLVVHTLVENGLTHGYANRDRGVFRLTCERNGAGSRITLFNDGRVEEDDGEVTVGTGLRYVQSRLEELYPSRWSLESGPVADGWEVTLAVRKAQ